MAGAGSSFASAAEVGRAAEDFLAAAATARFEVYDGTGGGWRWKGRLGADVVAESTSGFTTTQNA